MKPEIPNDDLDRQLRQRLREWKVESPLPPRFEEQVWHRIASEDEPTVNLLTLLRSWLAHTVMRPAFAFSYATVLLLAGLLVGSLQAHVASQRATQTLSARYVQMVDPYQMPRH